MKLIIGLGNPTKEYQDTRHNLGFICLDSWAEKHNKRWTQTEEFDFVCLNDTALIKPNTYMNRSGVALKKAVLKWKIGEVLVIYDDLELDIAELRIRKGGGDGGHNGIKSLFTVLPPAELKRIRIGIGKRNDAEAQDYVLACIPAVDWELLIPTIANVTKFMDTFIKYDFDQVLNEYSIWKKSYSSAKGSGIISPKEENNDKGL
ncbi:MAG: aminoacyl-tRNA hydrolase [Candidatus Cloacimonetes bacterium]|nr:aminoacyl-tRNA hydrolase [Candidatus Cloacimonadota bacterium]